MSIQLDDDLYEILLHASGGPCAEAWAVRTIVKLVMDNQQLRKMVQVTRALEPNQYDSYAAQEKARLHAHNYATTGPMATGVNQAATNPRAILDAYKNQYPAVDTFIPSIDDVIKDSTPKGG